MTAPTCPEHGSVMLELARGRLEDRRAMEAEAVRRDCTVCARWWDDTFGDGRTAELDAAVAEAFESFVRPRARRFGWLAAAAAVVLAVALGTTALLWHEADTTLSCSNSSSAASEVLSTWDFEDGELEAASVPESEPPTAVDRASGETAVFRSDLESGDLSSWSTHS